MISRLGVLRQKSLDLIALARSVSGDVDGVIAERTDQKRRFREVLANMTAGGEGLSVSQDLAITEALWPNEGAG